MPTLETKSSSAGWLPAVTATHGAVVLNFDRTDLRALLASSLVPLVAQARREGVELRIDALENIPPVLVDRELLAWVVATLVGNALRYTSASPAGCILVHLFLEREANEVGLAVHDNGPGMAPERLSQLFVRRPGALHAGGLALSLARAIVGAHDGRIEVESNATADDHGTSVTLRLPLGR